MTRKHGHPPEPSESPNAGEPTPQDSAAEPGKGTERPEYRDLVDQLQRLAAEYANYQKRMDQRLAEEHQHGAGRLAIDILPALDNLERALAAAEAGTDPDAFLPGVRVAHEELLAALRKHGVMPIEAVGRPFDPHVHEAIAHLPSEDQPEGHVLEESRKGYRMGDRTIRPSRVAVSRGPSGRQASRSPGLGADEPGPMKSEMTAGSDASPHTGRTAEAENKESEGSSPDEGEEPYADV